MTRYILLALFMMLTFAPSLGLDYSLAPGLSLKNAVLYMTIVLLAIESALTRNRKLEMLSVLAPFVLLVLYALLTWLVIILALDRPHYDAWTAFIGMKGKLVDHLLLLLVFFYGVASARDAAWLMRSLMWVVVASNVIVIVDTWNIPDLGIVQTRLDGRVIGFFGGPNESAAVVAFFLPVVIAHYWVTRGAGRWFAMVGILTSLIALFIFESRGAIVGLVLGAVLAMLLLWEYVSARVVARAAVLAAALCAIALAALLATEAGHSLQERMLTGIGTGSKFELSSGRTMLWIRTLQEMADVPVTFLTGFGWDAYFYTQGTRLTTHNTYLGHLYNLGLIGLSLLLLTHVGVLAAARKGIREASAADAPYLMAFAFAAMALLVALLFSDNYLVCLYTWPLAGAALRLAITSKRSQTSANTAGEARHGPRVSGSSGAIHAR